MERIAELCLSCEPYLELLRRELAEGLSPNTRTSYGYSMLHCCAIADWDEALDGRMALLLQAGADPNAISPTQYGSWTPLLLAAIEGHASQLMVLISSGADVNYVAQDGITALMLAAKQSLQPLRKVVALVAAGARTSARDENGLSALDYAKRHCSYKLSRAAEFDPAIASVLSAYVLRLCSRIDGLAVQSDVVEDNCTAAPIEFTPAAQKWVDDINEQISILSLLDFADTHVS